MKVKTKIAAVLAGLMVVGGAGSAFAAEAAAGDTSARSKLVEKIKKHPGIAPGKAREYQEELDTLNGLRTERLELKADISGKRGQVLDLTISADDNGNTEALQAAKKLQSEITALTKENGKLSKLLHADLADFRKADKAGDTAQAHSELKGAADTITKINVNLKQQSALLDELIAALQ